MTARRPGDGVGAGDRSLDEACVGESKPRTHPDRSGRATRRMVPRRVTQGYHRQDADAMRTKSNPLGMRAEGLRVEAPAGRRERGRSRGATRERLSETVHLPGHTASDHTRGLATRAPRFRREVQECRRT